MTLELQTELQEDSDEPVETNVPVPLTTHQIDKEITVLSAEDLRDWEDLINLLNSPAKAEHLVWSLRAANAEQALARDPSLARLPTKH